MQAGAALIGGETAEMPGFYPVDEYDLAGFSVGVVDKEKVLHPEYQKAGDILIALPSSGVHSNGFSLVRKVFDVENRSLTEMIPELGAFARRHPADSDKNLCEAHPEAARGSGSPCDLPHYRRRFL